MSTTAASTTVTITYTFTLAYVNQDPHENADIWVGAPTVNCSERA